MFPTDGLRTAWVWIEVVSAHKRATDIQERPMGNISRRTMLGATGGLITGGLLKTQANALVVAEEAAGLQTIPYVGGSTPYGQHLSLAMPEIPMAEFWLDKPVLAINTATYWHALRQNGIDDRISGFGSLLEDF